MHNFMLEWIVGLRRERPAPWGSDARSTSNARAVIPFVLELALLDLVVDELLADRLHEFHRSQEDRRVRIKSGLMWDVSELVHPDLADLGALLIHRKQQFAISSLFQCDLMLCDLVGSSPQGFRLWLRSCSK